MHPRGVGDDGIGGVQALQLLFGCLGAHFPGLFPVPGLGLFAQAVHVRRFRGAHHLPYLRGRPGLAQLLHVIRSEHGGVGKGRLLADVSGRNDFLGCRQSGVQRQAPGLKAASAQRLKLGDIVVVLGFQQGIEFFLLFDRQQRNAPRHLAHGVFAAFSHRRAEFQGQCGIVGHDLRGDLVAVFVEEVGDIFERGVGIL